MLKPMSSVPKLRFFNLWSWSLEFRYPVSHAEAPTRPAQTSKTKSEGPKLAKTGSCLNLKRRLEKKLLLPGTPPQFRKWSLERPRLARIALVVFLRNGLRTNYYCQLPGMRHRLAKIGFVVFIGEGFRRNYYCQARGPNLENEAWKGPSSPK